QPRRDAIRDAGRLRAVPRQVGAGARPDPDAAARPAVAPPAGPRPGPGSDLPEGDGEETRGSLRLDGRLRPCADATPPGGAGSRPRRRAEGAARGAALGVDRGGRGGGGIAVDGPRPGAIAAAPRGWGRILFSTLNLGRRRKSLRPKVSAA